MIGQKTALRVALLSWTLALLTACNLPINVSFSTPEPASVTEAVATPEVSPAAPLRPTPTSAPLGTAENPIILALPPSLSLDGARVEAGKALAELLAEETGYTFVVVAPETESKLIQAMGRGNAHIAMLSPLAYTIAHEQGLADAAFAGLVAGEKTYGAQFIARADAGFTSYVDAENGENTADAMTALSQFKDKKPCWSDKGSFSGYIVPFGYLLQNGVDTRPAAFIEGQPSVVRAVYARGICDFGGTYIDARTFPALEDDYPDVMRRVVVIWRTPPVIPFDNISLARSLPWTMADELKSALFKIFGTQTGEQLLRSTYGLEAVERVDDVFYNEFRAVVQASGVKLEELGD